MANITKDINSIILVTEPYSLKNNHLPTVHHDLTSYYKKSKDLRPRAAILVHKHLLDQCWELTQFTTQDQVAIKITYNKKDMILISTYMDGKRRESVPPLELRQVVEYANRQDLPLVIGYIRFKISSPQKTNTKQIRIAKNTDMGKLNEELTSSQELLDLSLTYVLCAKKIYDILGRSP